MRTPFTLASLALITGIAHAQCTDVAISTFAIPITQSGTTGIEQAQVWVCGGLDVTINGSLLQIFVEEGSQVQVIGNYNTIYVKAGNVLNVMGDSSIVYYFPTATVNVTGTNVLQLPCTPMTFDYTNAPSGGCALNIGIAEVHPEAHLSVGPDPCTDQLSVGVDHGTIRSVHVLDLSGRIMAVPDLFRDGSLDVRALRSGTYVLQVCVGAVTLQKRFVKQ